MDLPSVHENVKSNVLVVDDNKVNQKVLQKVLEANGYGTFLADNGQEALERAPLVLPDLIMLDIQMPDIDGFEVCRRLKENQLTEDIPVIFITASDTVEDKVTGFEVGAADYIPRPLQMPEVLARVSNQLTIRRLQIENEHETERLSIILDALPVPYFISIVESGEFIEINDFALEKFGIDRDEVSRYRSVDFYAHPEGRPNLIAEVLEKGRVSNKEIELKNKAHETFTALYSAVPLKIGRRDGFFVTFNDISDRKQMEQALEKAATTDYLTGTLNRRAFTDVAEREVYRARRNNNPLTMMLLDIDHFKVINDTYGHDVGDKALKILVQLVGHDLRTSDALGRLGGEEFALLLPETDLNGASILAERIRKRVENHVLETPTGKHFSMTISAGIALWTEDMTYECISKVVDECLYKAKNTGRNKIVSC